MFEGQFASLTNKGKAIAQIQGLLSQHGMVPSEKDYTANNGFAKIGPTSKGGQYTDIFAAYANGYTKFLFLEDHTLPGKAGHNIDGISFAADGLSADFSGAVDGISELGLVVGLAVAFNGVNGNIVKITDIDPDTGVVTFDGDCGYDDNTVFRGEQVYCGLLVENAGEDFVFRGAHPGLTLTGVELFNVGVAEQIQSTSPANATQVVCTGTAGSTALTSNAAFGGIVAGDWFFFVSKGNTLAGRSRTPIQVAEVLDPSNIVLASALPFDVTLIVSVGEGLIDNTTVNHTPAASWVEHTITVENLIFEVDGGITLSDLGYPTVAYYNDLVFNVRNASDYQGLYSEYNRCTFSNAAMDDWVGVGNAVLNDCVFEDTPSGSEVFNSILNRCVFKGPVGGAGGLTLYGSVLIEPVFYDKLPDTAAAVINPNLENTPYRKKQPFTGTIVSSVPGQEVLVVEDGLIVGHKGI